MLENVTLMEKKQYYYTLLALKYKLLNRKERFGMLSASQEVELACLDPQIAFMRENIPDNEL